MPHVGNMGPTTTTTTTTTKQGKSKGPMWADHIDPIRLVTALPGYVWKYFSVSNYGCQSGLHVGNITANKEI